MPNLKTLTKELRQEIVSYLYPLPSISSNLAFRLAIHIFTKTRFSSHINFISRCLEHKVIPKGFRSNFHASIFSNVSNFNLKYLHEIQRTQNTFSRNIMRSTIRAMCSKRNELNKQIIECRSQLSNGIAVDPPQSRSAPHYPKSIRPTAEWQGGRGTIFEN